MASSGLYTVANERLLTRREVGEFLKIPPATLAAWAYKGLGPPYLRVGRHALYRESELLEWLETRRAN